MSDFILVDFDYIDFIQSEDDIKTFLRMKELEPMLAKPLKECLLEVLEFSQCDRKLRGLEPLKILIQGDPKNN